MRKHDSPIFGELINKGGGVTDATQDQQRMDKATTHYLTDHASGPMVKSMPRGGFGERTSSPTVENADETELVVDSSIFDAKVRQLVQSAGAEYSIKAALADGRAIAVDPAVAQAVQRLQNHAPLLNSALIRAQQRRGGASGSASGGGSSTSAVGNTSDDTIVVDGKEMDKAELVRLVTKRAISIALQRGIIFKADKHPSRMNKSELSALLDTIPPGTPAYLSVNRQLAKVLYA